MSDIAAIEFALWIAQCCLDGHVKLGLKSEIIAYTLIQQAGRELVIDLANIEGEA